MEAPSQFCEVNQAATCMVSFQHTSHSTLTTNDDVYANEDDQSTCINIALKTF